ncbi:MAG: AbrB/MazE/SpoVT family DNA-binding domain-containing protein [Candidatus Eremiobacteraeota bacterium]|nr:AbrB/MazE/SpoVT family DNA-binding domain-containing protein [Candidatus Eremiobacteraeota bacterium]
MNETKIARYGNSLTVRLPAALARDLGFREGDRVQIRRLETGIAIERPVRARLEERLSTVLEQQAELSSGSARGAERFA